MILKVVFSPEAYNDLEKTKAYLTNEFGLKTSNTNIKKVIKSIRSLERFPFKGPGVWERYGIESDYRYLYTNHNYVFYRVDNECVKIIRILDARCDFLNILFGIKTQTDDIN